MKVVLLRDIAKLGQRGSVKEVANGYALNVLIPKGWAQMATEAVLHELKAKEDAKIRQKEMLHSVFLQLIDKLRENPIKISGLKNKSGSLFAHVNQNQIVDAIFKSHAISLNAKQIHIHEPIKTLGVHNIDIEDMGNGGKKESVQVIVTE